MKGLYELARNFLLNTIAYKFEFRAGISEMVAGVEPNMRLARDLSRLIADEYSGKKPNEEKIKRVAERLQFRQGIC